MFTFMIDQLTDIAVAAAARQPAFMDDLVAMSVNRKNIKYA